MNIEAIHTSHTKGYVVEVRGRCFIFGVGYDKYRRFKLRAPYFKLTNGCTGSIGIGRAWFFYGIWRSA